MFPTLRLRRAEYIHSRNVLSSDEIAFYEGTVNVSKNVTQIPSSIRVRNVRVTNADESISLLINASLSLPGPGAHLKLRCAGKYVSAYEVTDDAQVQ